MPDESFNLSSATTLFTQQTTALNGLWAVYAAATFAAAGYGLSAGGVSLKAAAAVSIGYLIFAAGNWVLIRQAIRVNRQLREDILAALNVPQAETQPQPHRFEKSIRVLVTTFNPLRAAAAAHLIIDVCVLVALLSHAHSN